MVSSIPIVGEKTRPHHAVCVPFPSQGHINPVFQLAKLLHSRGFHITFVHTEYNHRRLLNSRGPAAVQGLDDFRYETIPDGLYTPGDDEDRTQDVPAICDSMTKNTLPPFRQLITKLNDPSSGSPPVSCIIADGIMSTTLDAADEFGIPEVLFWTPSACGFMCHLHYQKLIDRGVTPLKSESDLTNGYLDTPIDWIPGMTKNMRLKDLPSFIRATDPNDIMLNFVNFHAQRAWRASAIILNTFEELERPVLDAMRSMLARPIYTIAPLLVRLKQRLPPESPSASLNPSLWTVDTSCLEWLESKAPASVVYVNFGSITVMTSEQLIEFAWGLANSNCDFLWIVRSDLVRGDSAVLPPEFMAETGKRGMMASWCDQEAVLGHPAVGGFLTHNGWNSTLESLSGGVPMIAWPFFAEQQTNCRYMCTEWGVGMEIDNNVKREEVEGLVRELMGGPKGKEMRMKALEWKESAIRAAEEGGTSQVNLERLINQLKISTK